MPDCFHDPWIRRLFLLLRRWWSLLALLLVAKKALVFGDDSLRLYCDLLACNLQP